MAEISPKAIQVFYCYAPQDRTLRDELADHLMSLRRLRQITAWFDGDVQAGIAWTQEIKAHLTTAKVILFLVSASFIASDECYTVQMKLALDRQKTGQAQIIPIIVRPVLWEDTPIGKLQSLALPTSRIPVTLWSNRDDAWLDVARGIRDVIKQLLPKKALSAKESLILDRLGSAMPSSSISSLIGENDAPAMLPIGTILDGKFQIVQVLGKGGMGTVYKVERVNRPGHFHAVKELLIPPNDNAEERKSAIERFDKEIDLLFNLKHPRIPSLILSFQERGNYYFMMEFVPGRSLRRTLEDNKGPLDEEKVIYWMMQVCETLSYIHSRTPPIILRDLKPDNIMVTPDGDVRLIDFGIARKFDPGMRTNLENMGTISYASPEHLGSITGPGQRRSAQNPSRLVQTDARSDIYSLGATMYHLLTNYEPDPIQTPPAGSIRAKNPRLRTMQIGGTVVCPIEQVIIKAMQQNPAHRFQNAEAMRMALLHCLPMSGPALSIQIPALSPNAKIAVSAGGLTCPKCGFQNRPAAKFCIRDGERLIP